ncbi:H-NS family nucleoid-associated regulatory protein [Vibrio breoganii]
MTEQVQENQVIDVFTDMRRLRKFLRGEFSLDKLEKIKAAVDATVIKVREDVEKAQLEAAEKEAHRNAVVSQVLDNLPSIDGRQLTASELIEYLEAVNAKPKTAGTGTKAAPKYRIEVDGEVTNWSGRGRTPVVFRNALEKNGGALDEFLIK